MDILNDLPQLIAGAVAICVIVFFQMVYEAMTLGGPKKRLFDLPSDEPIPDLRLPDRTPDIREG
jgi:hypothetical protein